MKKPSKARRRWLQWLLIGILLLAFIPLLHKGIDYTERCLYPLEYSDAVSQAASEYDIPPSLIYAVIHTESHFDPEAASSADAKGLMQLTDDTYLWARRRSGEKKGDTKDLFEPSTNIHYGTVVLHLLYEQFENTETVLAAYNAGQGRVSSWLEDPACSSDGVTLNTIPYEETADYVRRVLAAQKRYQQIYSIP